MVRSRVAAAVLAAAGMVGLAGCGGGPAFAEVEGTLTHNGKPLDNVRVEFWPEGDGPRSVGVTDAAGKYALTADDGKRSGAVVGPHLVVLRDRHMYGDKIVGRAGENEDLSGGKTDRIPPDYRDALKTPLKKTVSAGAKNVIDLDVK